MVDTGLQLAGFAHVAGELHKINCAHQRLTSLVFSALRVSAIWGRNWKLFSAVLALGFIPVVTNTVRSSLLGVCNVRD